MIEIERPNFKNYIILESLNQMKEDKNIKSIHIITLEDQMKITLGRGFETDIRINDISVSRMHASLLFSNGQMKLRDLKSKFGTLTLIKKDFEVINKKINLQIGRTYLEAVIKLNSDNKILNRK